MVSQADREIINSFVVELRPYLETVELGVQEFSQPNRDGVVVGQAVQALMMIRGAGQILMVEGLVSIASWLVESFEKIQNNPEIEPTEATRRLMGLYSAMDDYLIALDRGENADPIVLRAKTIFEAIPTFGGPLPGTGKLRPRTDLDALFGEDEHAAQTRRLSVDDADTERLAATAASSAGPTDQTAEIPEAQPTVPLQGSEDVTQPVSPDAATRRTKDAPARIVPIPPQPTEEIPRVDPELREIFEEEALEIIAAFGDGIRELARNPGDTEAIRNLNRAAHTLKGAANMTGFPLIAQIGAAIELLFDEQIERGQPVGRDVLELVAVSWKMLRAMVPNLNDLSNFTSPSNSIVQRANVLREQLALAHANAETIAMDAEHYGEPARPEVVDEPSAGTDQIVGFDIQPQPAPEALPEVDAGLIEAAPTVPLHRDPVEETPASISPTPEPEPEVLPDQATAPYTIEPAMPEPEVAEPEPAADLVGADAAPTAEIIDPVLAAAEQAEDEVIEITDEPADNAPFWHEPEATVAADEIIEEKPQSEPFWTPGTEELMRSSIGTDALIADIQGIDDLDDEVSEARPEADADEFFTSVDAGSADDVASTPIDDGSWLEEPEPPQTDLLDFEDRPHTEPFWNTIATPQSEPLEMSESDEPITMDPFFEPVDPDTSFLYSPGSEAVPEVEAPEDGTLESAKPAPVEEDHPIVSIDLAEDVDATESDGEAPVDDMLAGLEPFDPEAVEDVSTFPDIPELLLESLEAEAETDGDYHYNYAFDFEADTAAESVADEDVVVEEPTEEAPEEDVVEAELVDDATPEQVDVDVETVETPAEPDEQPYDEVEIAPAFDSAIAEVMAQATVNPAPVMPEPFAIAPLPVIEDAPQVVTIADVDQTPWMDAEALLPGYRFDPVHDEAAAASMDMLIETETPASPAEMPTEEFPIVDAAPVEDPVVEIEATDATEDVVIEDRELVESVDEAIVEEDILVEPAGETDVADVAVDGDVIVESAEEVDIAADEPLTHEAKVIDEAAIEDDVVVETTDISHDAADTVVDDSAGAIEADEVGTADAIVASDIEPVVDAVDADADAEVMAVGEDEVADAAPAHADAAEGVVIDTPDLAEQTKMDDAEPAAQPHDLAEDVLLETEDARGESEGEDVVVEAAETVEAAEPAAEMESAGEAASDDVVEDVVIEVDDSPLSEFDDVVASLEADDSLTDLDWFEEPAGADESVDLAEERSTEAVEIAEISSPVEDAEESQPATGRLTESGTGALGRTPTDALDFGSLDLDRFLTPEGSIALSSALLDMAFTAQPDEIPGDGLDTGSISVLDESSDRALEIEMFETFALEAEDHIAILNRAAMQLDRDPLAQGPLIDIKRALHTLKGAAAAADFMEISDLAHELEDSLAAQERLGTLSDRTFTAELFSAMERVEARLSQRKDELFGVSEEETQSGGTLRIDVDRVDDLLNTVGELVVNRSSFEERLERLETTLEDLSTAAARLQRSSYLLEREASSEDAIGRLLRGEFIGRDPGMAVSEVQSEWDMLEMDRYTEFDRLIRQLAEVGADVTTAVGEISALRGDFDTISNRQRRLTTALQDELMGIRMVPISSLAPRLYRVVRRAASQRGKEVSLIIEGGETPFDKILLDTLSESLLHLLRNSVDHGIEEINERRRLGKPEHGSIRIRAFRDGSEAVIEIIDDGAGIDHEAVIRHARERGMAIPDDISREEALLLIFEPGFTTRTEADDISGRGLGLEIVEQTVSRYKGRVAVDSVVGRGTVFSLRLPVMLSVIQAFLVSAGEGEFAIPVANVDYVVDRVDQPLTQIGNSVVIETANQIIPVVDVSARIGRSQIPVIEKESGWVMVTEIAGKRWALVVDELHGQQEIVVKPMGRFLRATPGLMGATILGHGDVALIVDVPALLGVDSLVTRLNPVSQVESIARSGGSNLPEAPAGDASPAHVVLVVDDSLSVRRVVSRTIERHGWVAVLARDGVEAMEMLEQGQASIVLTDIEMPRMDGFELISAIRSQRSLEELPIVVLTSRSGEKHRDRAIGLGANEYLVKPFQEQELVAVIESMSRVSSEA